MCVEREEEEEREVRRACQGARMGVLIKKTQIAAQQMIFLGRADNRTAVGGDKDA